MALASGLNAQLGFKVPETSWGTYTAPDTFVPLVSESLAQKIDRLESKGIIAGARMLRSQQWTPGNTTVGGDVGLEVYDHSIGKLLRLIFGGVATAGSGPYCVDESTEILTAEGWRRYDEIGAGTIVRTINHATGQAEWQPVESVHVFPAEPRELIRMKTRDHSSLTTTNHRWPVQTTRPGGMIRRWKTTETLAAADRLIKAAPSSDQPAEQKWSDELVELVAWTYTEGTIRESGSIRLCQSHAVNSDLCDRIAGVLRRMFGEPSDKLMGAKRTDQPRWAVAVDGRNLRFRLNKPASDLLHAVCPDKVPSFEFLRELTTAQLHLFIAVSLMADGDGTTDEVRTPRLCQTDKRRAEAFQFAGVLAGFGTSMHQRDLDGQWSVSLHSGTRTAIVDAARMAPKSSPARVERVMHDGIVWCPKTANASWLARRDGCVYFTGNTHTFTPGDLADDFATVQVGRPDVNGTVQPFSYVGCQVASAEIACKAGEIATMGLTLVGKSETTSQSLVAASYTSGIKPMTFVGAALMVAGSSFNAKGVTLKVDNGLDDSRRFIGSQSISQPLESKLREITGTVDAEFESLTAYNRFVNATEAALVFTLAAGSQTLVTTANVRFDGTTPNVKDAGITQLSLLFKMVGPTSDAGAITAVYTSSEATP